MATNYPASLDNNTTLPNPSASNPTNNPSLAGGQSNQNDAIKAIESKIGIGVSTPTLNKLLVGTGTGTSTWTEDAPIGTILGTTDTQSVSNKTITASTWTGGTITNPTITTDAVSGFTSATNGNIYGIPVTGSVINTANTINGASLVASSVGSAALQNTSVTVNKLSTGSLSATVNTSETTTSTSYADLATTTDSVTVTIGVNGLALVALQSFGSNSIANAKIYVSVAVSGATTLAASDARCLYLQMYATNAEIQAGTTFLIQSLAPGSTTFKMKYRVDTGGGGSGTGTFKNRIISVVPL